MSSFIDFIELIKLRVEVYHNSRVCGHWIINEHSNDQTCFHMTTQGCCELVVPDYGSWHLKEGDLVIFPKELPHSMTSSVPLSGPQEHLLIADSQHIEGTSMLCGKATFQHKGSQHLLDALPPVFVIQRDETTPWLSNLLALLIEESLNSHKNTNAIIDRQCELLFAYALRHFVEHDALNESVLALFSHRKISKAIEAIHSQPEYDWQLSSLAVKAGMSRTQFAQTFKKISGWTAMQYVTWWRMQLAWSYLYAGDTVALVAEKIGYQSEAAFSRAFSKHFGESAGSVRRSG